MVMPIACSRVGGYFLYFQCLSSALLAGTPLATTPSRWGQNIKIKKSATLRTSVFHCSQPPLCGAFTQTPISLNVQVPCTARPSHVDTEFQIRVIPPCHGSQQGGAEPAVPQVGKGPPPLCSRWAGWVLFPGSHCPAPVLLSAKILP